MPASSCSSQNDKKPALHTQTHTQRGYQMLPGRGNWEEEWSGEKKDEGSGEIVSKVRTGLRGRYEFEGDTNWIKVKSGKV